MLALISLQARCAALGFFSSRLCHCSRYYACSLPVAFVRSCGWGVGLGDRWGMDVRAVLATACYSAASGPIGVSRKRTFREVWRSRSLAGKTLSLSMKGRWNGCPTAAQSVPSVGAVTQLVPCTRVLHILRFKLGSSAISDSDSNLSVLLPDILFRAEILATMPCTPCR